MSSTNKLPDLQLAGGKAAISVFKRTQLPSVAPRWLDPGLTIKRAFNAGYQGLGTIH